MLCGEHDYIYGGESSFSEALNLKAICTPLFRRYIGHNKLNEEKGNNHGKTLKRLKFRFHLPCHRERLLKFPICLTGIGLKLYVISPYVKGTCICKPRSLRFIIDSKLFQYYFNPQIHKREHTPYIITLVKLF